MSHPGYGIPWPIAGPQPLAPLHSLLSSARVVDDVDDREVERWVAGAQVYPAAPGPAHVHDACAGGTSATKEGGEVVPIPEFGALTIYLPDECSGFGISGRGLTTEQVQERFVARATATLTAVESAAIEREFLTGEKLGLNPHLADGEGTFPLANTASSVVAAIGALENEIAKSGRRGMIHMTPWAAVVASSRHLLYEDGPVLRTINGTVVVPGDGYADRTAGEDISKPVGHSAPSDTQEWIYATGMVEIRRSEVITTPGSFAEAFDRETNTVSYLIERYYLVSWDTVVQAAVLLDRSAA